MKRLLKWLGYQVLTDKELTHLKSEIKNDAYAKAITNVIELLRHKNAIFLEPVSFEGELVHIENVAFFGGATANAIKKQPIQ